MLFLGMSLIAVVEQSPVFSGSPAFDPSHTTKRHWVPLIGISLACILSLLVLLLAHTLKSRPTGLPGIGIEQQTQN